MLPSLNKKLPNQQQFQATQIKLYNPPRQLYSIQQYQHERKSSVMSSSRVNSKIKGIAGFKKGQSGNYDNKQRQSYIAMQQKNVSNEPNYSTTNFSQHQNNPHVKIQMGKPTSIKDLSAEIKLIEKKIRYHKKKIQEQKKKKQQMQKNKDDPYAEDFEKIIKKQMQLQGYSNLEEEEKGFDYLTNPNKANQEPQQEPQQEIVIPAPPIVQKKFDLTQKIQKLEKHYQNSLKKKFERREMFPHYPCKRKTPKLYITTQTNTLQKFGKKPAQQQHIFRVMTRQCTPQQIYPTIPQFAIVKDNLSRNVMAYLGDFKPFLDKTRQQESNNDETKNLQPSQNNQPVVNGKNV